MAHESFEDAAIARADERRLRQHQGRPRGAARPRPDLPDRARAADAARRAAGRSRCSSRPNGAPFFGGTYFPKARARYGLPASSISCRASPPRTASSGADDRRAERPSCKAALASLEPDRAHAAALAVFDGARARAAQAATFDPEHGGFGARAQVSASDRSRALPARARTHNDADALDVVAVTLARMAEGGIHDQLGGGFCRYSVDAEWTIPHFEKMLYDNGPLLRLYADARAQSTGEPRFADVARGIVGWMTREMRAADGALLLEPRRRQRRRGGKVLRLDRDEVRALLSTDDYAVAAPYYGLDGPPNFEGHAWNLRVSAPLAEVADDARDSAGRGARRARSARSGAVRGAQPARAARPRRQDPHVVERARDRGTRTRGARARTCRHGPSSRCDGGRCAARAPRGATAGCSPRARASARISNAYLDDHAFLLRALLELMQTRFRADDCAWAREHRRRPAGRVRGSRGRRLLLHEPRSRARSSIARSPATTTRRRPGNGVAAGALIALGHLCAEPATSRRASARAPFAPALARCAVRRSTLLAAPRLDVARRRRSVLLAGRRRGSAARGNATLERTLRPVGACLQRRRAVLPAESRSARPRRRAIGVGLPRTLCLPPIDPTLDA